MNSALRPDREEVVSKNLGLVHSCAHKLKGRGIEYDDLFQAGCMGLVKAVDAFDYDRGVRFSTYAVPVILGEMRRLFRDGGAIKVSRTLKELSLKVTRMREQLAVELGREPTISQLARRMELDESDIIEALNVSSPPLSLTAGEDEGGGQIDLPEPSPEERIADLLSLKQVVGQLEPTDRKLIVLRYFSGKTQTQTAEVLGLTQVQVSRREKKILLALRGKLMG